MSHGKVGRFLRLALVAWRAFELSSFGRSAAETLFAIAALGAGKSNQVRRRGPWLLPCMDGHWPRVAIWTCDQQLIRLHCANSLVMSQWRPPRRDSSVRSAT